MPNEQLLNTIKETYCPMPRGCMDENKQGIIMQCKYINSSSFNSSHLQ